MEEIEMAICPICRREYEMGLTGIWSGCDTCKGIVRDGDGYAWEPDEMEMELRDVVTGKIRKVYRNERI